MRAWLAIVVSAWLLFTAGLLFWWSPPPAVEAASTIAILCVEAAAGVLCWKTAERSTSRTAWRALALAMFLAAASWLVGLLEILAGQTRPPAFEPANLGILVAYGFVGWAVLRFAKGAARRQLRWQALLDGTIIASSLALIAWVFIDRAAPDLLQRAGWETLYELALPVADVFLLTLILLSMGRSTEKPSLPLTLIAYAAFGLVFVDSAYWFLLQTGSLPSYAPLQGGWMGVAILVGLAAIEARRQPIRLRHDLQPTRPGQLVLPYVPASLAVLVGGADVLANGELHPIIFACGVLMVIALLVRQMVSLGENTRLADHLRDLANEAARTAREARADQQRHQALLNSLSDAVLLVDRDGRIQSADGALVQIFGRTATDLFGRHVDEIIESPAGGWVCASLGVDRFFSSQHARGLRRDGTSFDAEVTMPATPDVLPLPGARVFVVRDVTDRRRADEERRRHEQQEVEVARLHEMNRFKSNFLNMAAHELGTPLTPITIQLHLLQSDPDQDPARRRHSLAILSRNVDRLSDLVRDLLDAARIQSSRLRITPKPVGVSELLQEAVESYRSVAARAGVALDVRIMDEVTFECDAQRITQVVSNLLSNAIKFTPDGGLVRLESHRFDDEVLVSVHDSGRGLRAEDKALLFRPFSQVEQGAREGTGLGLYLSKGIVEASGGRMWCESPGEGQGSSFYFTLPLNGVRISTVCEEPVATAQRWVAKA